MFLDDDDDFDSDSEVEIEEQDLLKITIQKECKDIIKATYKGKKIVNGFEVMERLGQGGFATVRKCKFCPTGNLYAMKKMAKNWLRKKREWSRKDGKMVMHTMLDKVMVGVGILKELAHENVVRLHSVINDPGDDTLYLILDYCHRKCVMDWNADSLSFGSKVFAQGPHGGIELGAVACILAQALQGVKYSMNQDKRYQFTVTMTKSYQLTLFKRQTMRVIFTEIVIRSWERAGHFMSQLYSHAASSNAVIVLLVHKQGIIHRDLKPDNLLGSSRRRRRMKVATTPTHW